MSRRYKFHSQDNLYFVTYTTVNWIDLFTRDEYRNIVLDSLRFCQSNKGLEIYAWCFMTNHIHLIIGTSGEKMENILRDHKRHTSELITKAIETHSSESRREWILEQFSKAAESNSQNTKYQVWQQHNKPIVVYSEEVVYQYLDYIHYNPVKAGFVKQPEHWLYRSAVDYADQKGLLDVIPIDVGMRG
jgi:REP element-mobilizing transposase RayT